MTLGDFAGVAAGTLTTVAFIPQVIKTWRSRSADDISMFMFLLFSTGVLMWLVYGLTLNSWPMIIANGITLILAISIIVMKVVFDIKKSARLKQAEQRGL
ncbi:MAG: SemiSWEET transporter [Gammaproteobacteria bacterium]|nr:SemiSWEET transporter [Gammaproteobacteria bacterium]